MALNSPFTKTLYIDFLLLPLWSSLSELSEMLPPRLQLHFAQIKLKTLKLYIFFFSQTLTRRRQLIISTLAN